MMNSMGCIKLLIQQQNEHSNQKKFLTLPIHGQGFVIVLSKIVLTLTRAIRIMLWIIQKQFLNELRNTVKRKT